VESELKLLGDSCNQTKSAVFIHQNKLALKWWKIKLAISFKRPHGPQNDSIRPSSSKFPLARFRSLYSRNGITRTQRFQV